jgi:hypothetical protein
LRALINWAKRLGIAAAFVLLTFLLVNAQDEALSPELKAVLAIQPLVPPGENAFLFAMGIDAEPGRNPSQAGLNYLQQVRQVVLSPEFIVARKAVEESTKGKELKRFAGKLPCDELKAPCLDTYMSRVDELLRLREANRLLFDRYEQLLRFNSFEDAPYVSIHETGLSQDYRVAELYRAFGAVNLKEGRPGEYVERLDRQARFNRMRLRHSGILISKLIALKELRQSARLASAAVARDPTLAKRHGPALLEILRPLSVEERQLSKAIKGEAKITQQIFYDTTTGADEVSIRGWLYGIGFKRNSTVNLIWDFKSAWLRASDIPTEGYLAVEQEVLAEQDERVGILDLFYNPVGKFTVSLADLGRWSNFFRHIIDTHGLLRLVSLQVQIAARGVKEADIPDFLAKTDPKYHDPYTGKPMQWSKERGLHFRGYSDRLPDPDGWVSVRL